MPVPPISVRRFTLYYLLRGRMNTLYHETANRVKEKVGVFLLVRRGTFCYKGDIGTVAGRAVRATTFILTVFL